MNDEGMEEEEDDDNHDNQTNGGSSAAHGSATNMPKEIKFNVHHKYTTYNVTILDRSTVGKFFNYFAVSKALANIFNANVHYLFFVFFFKKFNFRRFKNKNISIDTHSRMPTIMVRMGVIR